MTIKQQGGVFGRNPTFNDVTVDGDFNGKHIDLNDGLPYINLNSTESSATPRGFGIKINGTEIASIRTNPSTGDLQIISGFTGWGGKTSFYTNGNLAGQFDSAGNLAFPAGQGIDFSATSGTGTSELFDDYEEGTWTPTFGDWTTAPTVVYANYTKIGNQVTVTMYGYDGVTNYSTIGGLPFAAASNAVGAGVINSSSSYSIRAGCSVLASATALSGIEGGDLTGVYWQLCATYFA